MKIACVLVTRLRAKVELQRRPELRDRQAVIAARIRGRAVVAGYFPAVSGVVAGMPLEQALSRLPEAIVLEADEAACRGVFERMLRSLQGVSDRVEGAELGVTYLGLDGLEAVYGGGDGLAAPMLEALPPYLSPRVGTGGGKFPAYAAARAAPPSGISRVPADVAGFLALFSVDLLPLPAAVKSEMRSLGLRFLGDVAAMERDALIARFGRPGLRAWELVPAGRVGFLV